MMPNAILFLEGGGSDPRRDVSSSHFCDDDKVDGSSETGLEVKMGRQVKVD